MKRCPRCKKHKEVSCFSIARRNQDGLVTYCKPCAAAISRVWHEKRKSTYRGSLVDGEKICNGCGNVKCLESFHVSKTSLDGRSAQCGECNNARTVRYMNNPENRASITAWRHEWRSRSPRSSLSVSLSKALTRRPTGNPASLDAVMKMWKEQEGKCAISGVTMTWATGSLQSTSITLDRIDQTRGYSADNLRLACHAANTFRGRMSDDQMYEMAVAIVTNMKRPKLQLVS